MIIQLVAIVAFGIFAGCGALQIHLVERIRTILIGKGMGGEVEEFSTVIYTQREVRKFIREGKHLALNDSKLNRLVDKAELLMFLTFLSGFGYVIALICQ